ncbi:MAG: TatD family hydrolase [Brumimicrobium sp.]|nr:TatD family hydrolase [Brumimicrobium sp.]MCO5269598.1 TatD family hydrolase [Brumimicrobium sp.]
MAYIDTHAHLYLENFDEDRKEVMQRAINEGVEKIFLPNIDGTTLPAVEKMVKDYPDTCYPMIGIHPCDVRADWEEQLTEIRSLYKKDFHVAIGEIGIDLYWDKTLKKEQILSFTEQIRWAKAEGLPIVIHSRDSFDEIFEVMDKENDTSLFGIFHCFTGTIEQAHQIIDYGGFKLGIGGVVTFKNSHLDEVIKDIDLCHLVLETDAPFLTPAPFRGKRNESSYIPLVAKKLSSIFGIDENEIGRITTQNALEVFKIK